MSVPPRSHVAPFGRLLAWAVVLALAAACQVTPFQRTLPDWVRRVHVPMAVNQTAEPGLEELVTQGFQDRLLLDGRLELVQTARADAVARITIRKFVTAPAAFSGDDIESARTVTLTLDLELFEPNDLINPFARADDITVTSTYGSNYRSSTAFTAADARRNLGAVAGVQVLNALLNRAQPVPEAAK